MWMVREEPDTPPAAALLRDYFTELAERYWRRAASAREIDETLAAFPTTGLAHFFVLRTDDEPAGCLGLHASGELTRVYVAPRLRRLGGRPSPALCRRGDRCIEALPCLFLDTRYDLIEARAFYVAAGFVEIPPRTTTPGQFQDHWFEKVLVDS